MALTGNSYLFGKFGDVDFPVEGSDVTNEQLFSVLDPGLDQLLSFFKAAINQELGHSTTAVETTSPWWVARAGTPLSAVLPVADTIYEPPRSSILKATGLTFPLLALYRQKTKHDEWTLNRDQLTTIWGLDYILGPLNPADYRRLGGVLNAVRRIVNMVIRSGRHPAFESDALQFGTDKGLFKSIGVTEDEQGPATFGEDGQGLEFHALHMAIETTELEEGDADAAGGPFEGADYTIGIGEANSVLPDVIEAATDVPLQPPLGKPQP